MWGSLVIATRGSFLETHMSDEAVLWLATGLPVPQVGLIGPKAASLCTVRGLGLPVPPCFFVTTVAFREHLDGYGLASQIASRLAGLDSQPDRIPSVLDEIHQLILSKALGDALRDQIAAAYDQLGAATVTVCRRGPPRPSPWPSAPVA